MYNKYMQKILVIITFIIITSKIVFAIEASPENIDLGNIPVQGSLIEKAVLIKNNENNTIFLEKIRSSCGCLLINSKAEQELRPNDTYKIDISFDPKQVSPGKFIKYIFLQFRNAEKSVIVINVKGNLK